MGNKIIKAKVLKEFLNNKKPIVIETTTVGKLKRQMNENKFMLGNGFRQLGEDENKPNNKPKKDVQMAGSGNNGAAMLGNGFKLNEALKSKLKNLNREGLVSLVESIVNSMKGNNDYTNLRFVDNIGKKWNLNESSIKKIKNIVINEDSKKLYNYVLECSCMDAQNTYQGYEGLSTDASSMIPQIKSKFNINRRSMPLQQALNVTSVDLGLPMEMVGEMYEAQKMKTEGDSFESMNQKLTEIYEKYQKLSEGDMFEMYDEIAEYMDYPSSDEHLIGTDNLTERDDESFYLDNIRQKIYNLYQKDSDLVNFNQWIDDFDFSRYGITPREFFYDDEEYQAYQMRNDLHDDVVIDEDDMSFEDDIDRLGDDDIDYFGDNEDYEPDWDFEDEMEVEKNQLMAQDYPSDEDLSDEHSLRNLDDIDQLNQYIDYEPRGFNETEELFKEIEDEMKSYMNNTSNTKLSNNIELDEAFGDEMSSDMETNTNEIEAINPTTGEVESYEILPMGNGFFMVNGDSEMSDVKVQVVNGELIGGESLPSDIRQQVLDMSMSSNEMSNDDEISMDLDNMSNDSSETSDELNLDDLYEF